MAETAAMMVQLTTRHSEDFDIHTETVDPALSSYVQEVRDYASRVTAFYSQLGVRSAIWTVPASQRPESLETIKPVEFLLELAEDRIVAYVDESTWSDYLADKRGSFDYSTTPMQYKMTSILVATPITKAEVKAVRRYRCTNGPNKYELVEEIIF